MGFDPLSEFEPKARKIHKCEWCHQDIIAGEKYYRYSGICDGVMQSTAMHLDCRDAMHRDVDDSGDYEYYLPNEPMPRGKTIHEREEEEG